ncbi:MAG: hypothetical protein MHPSP_003895 [Paramarteilia canceri]
MKYCFLERNWSKDQVNIERYFEKVASLDEKSMVLFPEGYLATTETLKTSNEFGAKNGLPPLKHLLYPRHNGLSMVASKINDILSIKNAKNKSFKICDCTIYFKGYPMVFESDIFRAKDFKVFMDLNYYDLEEVLGTDLENKTESKETLYRFWQEKDMLLLLMIQMKFLRDSKK